MLDNLFNEINLTKILLQFYGKKITKLVTIVT
jgi:hypothetical protein